MKKSNRLLAMLMALAMVLAFMPAVAFAERDEENTDLDGTLSFEEAVEDSVVSEEEPLEDFIPAVPEKISAEPKNVADGATVVGISFSPNPITLWGPNITVANSDGSTYYDIFARYKWIYPDGTSDYWQYAPGDTLVVRYSDGSSITYTCQTVHTYGYYDAYFTDGEDTIWPSIEPERLVAGNNSVTITYEGCSTSVTVFVDTPELLAQREEAARQGTPDGSIPKVKISKPSTGKKSITVKWKKLTKKQLKKSKATKYEVWVCANTAFARGETSEHIINKSKAGVKIKKVPKGTYYVKVRAIKYVNGNKMVGPWSKTKKVKVKK